METTIYHSTNETCLKQILETKSVKTCQKEFGKRKKPGNLGYGFYGFSDKELCKQFGEEKIKNFKFLKCDILVCDEKIIDFRDEIHIKYYNTFKREIVKRPIYKKIVRDYQNNDNQSSLEGALIDLYLKTWKTKKLVDIDCLISMTVTQVSTSKNSLVPNGVEYCLKNKKVIKEMKEVIL